MEISRHSTLSAVKSNVFFKFFKVKSNSKKSEVQQPWYFTFFLKVKYNNRGTSLLKKIEVQHPLDFTFFSAFTLP